MSRSKKVGSKAPNIESAEMAIPRERCSTAQGVSELLAYEDAVRQIYWDDAVRSMTNGSHFSVDGAGDWYERIRVGLTYISAAFFPEFSAKPSFVMAKRFVSYLCRENLWSIQDESQAQTEMRKQFGFDVFLRRALENLWEHLNSPADRSRFQESVLSNREPASAEIGTLAKSSGHKAVDQRILEILNEIGGDVDETHKRDFEEALAAVGSFAANNLNQWQFNRGIKVSEDDFQRELLRHMRTSLRAEDVEEAPRYGGGPTDIKYKSVIVELKIEKKTSDRQKIVKKYCEQPTQYVAGCGGELGILAVLDLTKKNKPPSNMRSDILLGKIPTHGFPKGAPYPTQIAAVFINGNLCTPSSYSKG